MVWAADLRTGVDTVIDVSWRLYEVVAAELRVKICYWSTFVEMSCGGGEPVCVYV